MSGKGTRVGLPTCEQPYVVPDFGGTNGYDSNIGMRNAILFELRSGMFQPENKIGECSLTLRSLNEERIVVFENSPVHFSDSFELLKNAVE